LILDTLSNPPIELKRANTTNSTYNNYESTVMETDECMRKSTPPTPSLTQLKYDNLKTLSTSSREKQNNILEELNGTSMSYPSSGHVLLTHGGTLLRLVSDKKSSQLRKNATLFLDTLVHSVSGVVQVLFVKHHIINVGDDSAGLSHASKWQTKLTSLKLLSSVAESHPTLLAQFMPTIVPIVSELMWDTKRQVAEEAGQTMHAVSKTVDNVDLQPFIPQLLDAIREPSNVPDCVYALAGTTFVTTVNAAALSITVPILARGFKERSTVIKRKCAVITENLAKLVKDARDVAPFMPVLLPVLKGGLDTISDPECRDRFKKAHDILQGIGGHDNEVRDHCRSAIVKAVQENTSVDDPYFPLVVDAVHLLSMYSAGNDKTVWQTTLETILNNDSIQQLYSTFDVRSCVKDETQVSQNDEDETAEAICDLQFSLAYGTNILLNDARLHILKGKKYGIIANKSAGKTTLMRAIANGQIAGFPLPSEVRTAFIENDIQGAQQQMNVVEFVKDTLNLPGQEASTCSEEEIRNMLTDIGFTAEMSDGPITSLSGGWKMKLALGRATLQKADIMLMDEPTNHLDVLNVQWVVDYLNSLPEVTCLIVSHDTAFLNKTVSHIIHFDNLKLNTYKGNVATFMDIVPDAKSYFELNTSSMTFKFPQPTALQSGSKSNKGRTLLQMKGVSFTYPSASKPQLNNVNVKASMASRVAIVGANGAGKSTLIKLLTGEMKPSSGEVKKHPNCRFAYVAQHAFHHIEQHLDKSPNKYICEVTDEEEKRMSEPWLVSWKTSEGEQKREKRVIEKIIARRKSKKTYEYEVRWIGKSMDLNTWYGRDLLVRKGFAKMVDALDTRLAAAESMNHRPLTQKNVTAHLAAVGLEEEHANHSRIRDLSGGQKVKVVLAACTWACPHLIILDEPTNYLDRDSLGALANAITEFEGGVVLITHNKEFADLTTRETWVVANNMCDVKGDPEWEKYAAEQQAMVVDEEETDAYGNKIEKKERIKKIEEMSRKEIKMYKKSVKGKIKRGEELETHELIWAEHWNLL